MSKLKSCPFCGEKADYKIHKNHEFDTVIVLGCTNMFCFCKNIKNLGCAPKKRYVQMELQDMINQWNFRR